MINLPRGRCPTSHINERRSAVLVVHGNKAHSRYYPPVKPAEGGTEICTHFDYRPAILLPRQGVGLVVNLPESEEGVLQQRNSSPLWRGEVLSILQRGVIVEIPPFACLGSNFCKKDTAWWVV